MEIKQAEFFTSVADASKIIVSNTPEIAIAGKSNVGKSSFINLIANNSKLAKTSKEPGRTRLINYFSFNKSQFYLVDLPGYGFARVSEQEKLKWGGLIEGYLLNSPQLKNFFLLLDIRHTPSQNDIDMISFLSHYNIQYTIIATKADKLSRAQQNNARRDIANKLMIGKDNVFVVSNYTKQGRTEILERIQSVISMETTSVEDI